MTLKLFFFLIFTSYAKIPSKRVILTLNRDEAIYLATTQPQDNSANRLNNQKESKIKLKTLFFTFLQSNAKNPSKRVILTLNRDEVIYLATTQPREQCQSVEHVKKYRK